MMAADFGAGTPAGMSAVGRGEPDTSRQIELYLPSILGYEKIARSAAETIAEELGFADDRVEDLKTAVAEACMNAIEHGNGLDRSLHVTVQMFALPDKLEVRVTDIGHQPVPASLPEPGTNGAARGWGIFFIRSLVDHLEIVRLPGGENQISMTLYRASGDGGHAAPERPAARAIQPAADSPKSVQVVTPGPVTLQPAEDRPKTVQAVTPQPRDIQPVDVPPRSVQLVEDKPGHIQVVDAADAPPDAPASPES